MPNLIDRVQVFNGDLTELTSTTPARARILVKERKAKVICNHPFAIRLNFAKEIKNKDHSRGGKGK